jgi:uroporphyrin-III C-methyltransferase / precorrin-2 dehydrogenase / sirohydrochlorin ferrochelatase
MDFLPIFMKVTGRACLVVGGGEVALRKIEMLRRAHATIRVVATEISPKIMALAADEGMALRHAAFAPSDLDGAALVIAATDDRPLNERISKLARLRGVPVNVVDDPDLCTFIMPAIVDRAPVLVAVSTGGCSPVLARRVRALIEEALPQRLGDLARLSAQWRARVKAAVIDPIRRRQLWERVIDGPVAATVEAGDLAIAEAMLAAEVEREQRVAVGVVPGVATVLDMTDRSVDLLTLRDLGALRTADLLIYDADVDPAVLDFARRDAERLLASHATERLEHVIAEAKVAGRAVVRIVDRASILALRA